MAGKTEKDMAGSLDELFKSLEKVSKQAANVATQLGKTSEKLSNTGADKLTAELKAAAKSTGVFNDEQLSTIKGLRDLEKVLATVEDQYEDIAVAAAKREKKLAALNSSMSEKAMKNAKRQIDNEYKQELIRLKATEEYASNVLKTVPIFRQQAKALTENVEKYDKLNKTMETMQGSIKSQIASFATATTAIDLFKKALTISYDQLTRLTQRGMLGAFTTINTIAPKLLVSAQDFEEIINRNRDIVNSMGGGVVGVERFGEQLQNARAGLEYLGKEGTKAAARFMETAKTAGLTPKDGMAYQQTMNNLKKQFREFSGLFGDSFEEYAALIDAQVQEENTRNRLNNLSKTQLQIELQEIQKRTENLKLMGLSNQQIIEFNKRTEEMNNPRKSGQIGKRMTEAVMAKNLIANLLNTLSPDSQQYKDLAKNQGILNEYANARGSGNTKRMKEIEASNPDALKAVAAAMTETDKAGQFATESRNIIAEMGGDLTKMMFDRGGALLTADAQGKNQSGKTAEELAKLKEQAMALTGEGTKLEAAFKAATIAVEGFKSLMENPIALAAAGLVASFAAIIGAGKILSGAMSILSGAAGGVRAAFGMIGNMVKGVWSLVSKIPGMAKMFGLGAAAAGIDGAITGAGTDTSDYRKRLGMDESGGLAGDLLARSVGVLSDVGTSAVKGLTLGSVDLSKNFTDKQIGSASASQASKVLGPGQSSGGINVRGFSGASSDVQSAITSAAAATGVNPQLLAAIAAKESNFKANAKASRSSATGLFQFTNSTWMDTIKKNGAKYGINTNGMSNAEILALRNDPRISALMGAELVKANQAITGDTSSGGTYLAHFLGAGGAKKVLNADPNTPIENVVGADQMAKNANVFKNVRTAGDLKNWAQNGMNKLTATSVNTGAMMAAGAAPSSAGGTLSTQDQLMVAQNQMIAQLVRNTAPGTPKASDDSYKADTSVVMNGISA